MLHRAPKNLSEFPVGRRWQWDWDVQEVIVAVILILCVEALLLDGADVYSRRISAQNVTRRHL